MTYKRSICVYCGSQPGNDPAFTAAAEIIGRSLAENGCTLVYGGGAKGIMGAVSNAARQAGGTVKSVIPEFLLDSEGAGVIDRDDPDTFVTPNMHVRKQTMFEHSDAFMTLPGGIGTLEEVIEMMTWAQLGRHAKPIAFLNILGFWDPIIGLLDHMQEQGFIHSASLLNPLFLENADRAVPELLAELGEEAS